MPKNDEFEYAFDDPIEFANSHGDFLDSVCGFLASLFAEDFIRQGGENTGEVDPYRYFGLASLRGNDTAYDEYVGMSTSQELTTGNQKQIRRDLISAVRSQLAPILRYGFSASEGVVDYLLRPRWAGSNEKPSILENSRLLWHDAKGVHIEYFRKAGAENIYIKNGQSLLDRLEIYFDISRNTKKYTIEDAEKALFVKRTTRGTPRIRPEFRDAKEVERNPYVKMGPRITKDLRTRFMKHVSDTPNLSGAQALEKAIIEYLDKYENNQ